ncbi:MAG: TlpA family protein disulfide reductase [Verrucomicrobia bacterium]|nr:TlpA family protein disulfide reductase [Verrucomicrobiota bacterium]
MKLTTASAVGKWLCGFWLLGVLGHVLLAQTPPAAPPPDAGQAWEELMLAARPPQPPDEWRTKEPTPEQLAEFTKRNAEMAGQAADQARAFSTNFPAHAKAKQARDIEYQLLNQAAQLGDKTRAAQLAALEEARLQDPKTTEDERFDVRMRQTMRPFLRPADGNKDAVLAEMEKSVRVLQKEFPKRQEVFEILLTLAQAQLENSAADKSRVLAKEVADTASGEFKENAAALLRKLDRLGKPLKLKFTSVDGDDIDLQKLRGKVVLVDFWATWCAPCRAALPEVKTVYKNCRAKGFEIVGLSFDESKERLQKFAADQGITWPQYFDGRGWENKFGREFEITSIPTMWLIDRKGNLRELIARENLARKVEKLLAE